MSYLTIPPILVVLSLAGIIWLLMRKVPQLKKLEEKNLKKNYDKNIKRNIENHNNKSESRLEKIKRLFKKLISFFIKTFKNKIYQKIKTVWKNKKMSEIQNIDKENNRSFKDKDKDKSLEEFFGRKEKVTHPMISKKIVRPQGLKENQFEKIMISRIASNPKNVKAYEELGEYYIEIKNWKDAKECFKQTMKLDPGNRKARTKIREIERQLNANLNRPT